MSHAPFAQSWAHGIYKQKYAHPGEEWPQTADRVVYNVMRAIEMEASEEAEALYRLIRDRKFLPGGRYLYAAGRDLHQTQNCLLLRAEDTREGWSELIHKSSMALMTGAGIGTDYSAVRPSGAPISRTGGTASGPLSLMRMTNEVGRNVMQGGARRSAIWAGLAWWHADIFDFIRIKDWSPEVRALKERDFTFPADLDMTNVSVILDSDFFAAYHGDDLGVQQERGSFEAPDGRSWQEWAQAVYWKTLDKMVTTAEPGFSVDYENPRESLRNACTEVTSEDDSDVCNLGSLNMAAFESSSEFHEAVELATLFLLAGTVYSDLPYDDVYKTREKNRRLGLGVMGIHEWLLQRDKKYAPDRELGRWLSLYAESTEVAAEWADHLGLSRPVKTRAIAPTGTIGIIAETTTGIEPIFCAAYKRRVRNASAKGDKIEFEYVVDPTAKKLIDQGINPEHIEDAYTLSYDVERRVAFQAWVQQFVDHGISSTINLPYPISDPQEQRDFGEMLLKHLPNLRGVTCYPDGARGGQPLTPVGVGHALEHQGVRFEESEERCVGGACGV